MKKTLYCLLIAVMLMVSWFSTTTEAKDVTIEVWVQMDAMRFEGYETVTKKFMEKYPDITVKLMNVPGGWSDLYQKLITSYVGGKWPDVIYSKGYALPEFAARGMLKDLTPYWNESKNGILNAGPKFIKIVEEGCSYKGKVYALPRGQYWYTPAYNVDLLKAAGYDRPPETWEEFREYAIKLTDKEKGLQGFAPYTYNRIEPIFVEAWIDIPTAQNGGSIMTIKPDGTPEYHLAGNEKLKEALQFHLDNLKEHGAYMDPDMEESRWELVYNGKVAMWWTHGGWVSRFKQAAPDLNYGVFPHPKKENQMCYIADQKFMVNNKTKHPDEAWKFIEHFTSQEMEAIVAPYEGHLSVWEENWELPAFDHPAYKGLIKQLQLPGTRAFQFHRAWVPIRTAIAREIQKVVYENVPLDQALEAAQKAADAEIAEVEGF